MKRVWTTNATYEGLTLVLETLKKRTASVYKHCSCIFEIVLSDDMVSARLCKYSPLLVERMETEQWETRTVDGRTVSAESRLVSGLYAVLAEAGGGTGLLMVNKGHISSYHIKPKESFWTNRSEIYE